MDDRLRAQQVDPFGARLSRRAAVRQAGAFGLAAGLAVRGIGRTAAQATPASAEEYPEVVVTATEYRFDLPPTIPGGLTRLILRNEGAIDHHAMFMRVNEGATLAELEAALQQPDFGPVFAASTSVGGPEVGPGREASVIVDLEPGEYVVICVIPDEAGVPHYLMGMQAPVEVTAVPAAAAPPAADATIDLADFRFEAMPMRLAPGRHVWEATNTGEQVHEMIVQRQAPGVTFGDVLAMLQPAPEATPGELVEADPAPAASPAAAGPPFELIGGVAPMSPGFTNWAVLDLEAGDYFAICFVPDPATGAPHFALGMLMPLTVG